MRAKLNRTGWGIMLAVTACGWAGCDAFLPFHLVKCALTQRPPIPPPESPYTQDPDDPCLWRLTSGKENFLYNYDEMLTVVECGAYENLGTCLEDGIGGSEIGICNGGSILFIKNNQVLGADTWYFAADTRAMIGSISTSDAGLPPCDGEQYYIARIECADPVVTRLICP